MAACEIHSFYCLNCGKKAMDLPRKKGHKHKDFHRKKLYCPWCKMEINCIEIKDKTQEEQFKIDFKNGVYNDEKEISLDHVRNSWQWQKFLGQASSGR